MLSYFLINKMALFTSWDLARFTSFNGCINITLVKVVSKNHKKVKMSYTSIPYENEIIIILAFIILSTL